MTTTAQRLARILHVAFPGGLPVRLRAWDGSEAGPEDAPTVLVRSRRALRRLLWQPGELGLAEAYIAGDLDIDGDLADGLSGLRQATRATRTRRPRPADIPKAAATAL